MNDERLLNEMLFDRLVDGDLSEVERRRLLESLDTRPDGWRRCALAFLEAQSWRENLRQFVREPAPIAKGLPTRGRSSRSRVGLPSLAIAVGLLLAVTLAVVNWANRIKTNRIVTSPPSTGHQVAKSRPGDAEPKPAKPDDALTLWVLDDGGKARPVRVPLVDAAPLDEALGVQFQPGLSDDARNQLRERGYQVGSKRRYAPMWLDNGQPMIVPVEDTKVVPVGY